jgi:outer membrane autotransporter protein
LKAQLAAEGYTPGADFTGSFGLRGVTYTVDPLILNINGITSYEGQALTPAEFAIGVALDSVPNNPAPGTPLFNLFNAIDLSGNVPAALNALSPGDYSAYRDLAIQNATEMVQEIDARLNNVRDGSESVDTGAGGMSSTMGLSKDDGKESKQVIPAPAPEKRWGMFATGDGLFFRGNSHDVGLNDTKSNTAGTIAGVDAKIGEHAIAGAFFAYDNADVTLDNLGSHATIESYSGGIYGSLHGAGFYANGLGAYTRNNYSSDRNILFPGFANTAAAGTHGNQYTGNLDAGYDWHVTNRFTVGPLVGLQYTHLDVAGFNEYGAGAASLDVGSQDMDSLQSRVGGRADFHLASGANSAFAAEVHAAWQHEYLDDSHGLTASFSGAPLTPFTIQTSSPLRDAAVVGAGLNFTFHQRLTLFTDYELQIWRASYFEQSVNAGGRISF